EDVTRIGRTRGRVDVVADGNAVVDTGDGIVADNIGVRLDADAAAMGKSGDVTLKRAATRRETDLVIGDHIGVRILRDGDGVGRVIGNPESLDGAPASSRQAVAGSNNVEAARESSAVNANA